jgi:hypothetical protein
MRRGRRKEATGVVGYPPDLAEGATQLVLRQAELSTENGG